MSLSTLDESLSTMDVIPGCVVSIDGTPARALYHETSTGAMILRGIHATTAEAFSTIENLQVMPMSLTEGVPPTVEFDLMVHLDRLRCQFEDISEMVSNLEERLSGTKYRLIFAGASGGSQESLVVNDPPPALQYGVIEQSSAEMMDVDSSAWSNKSSVNDLSSKDDGVIRRRPKRRISQVEEEGSQFVHRVSQCRRTVNRALRIITDTLWFW